MPRVKGTPKHHELTEEMKTSLMKISNPASLDDTSTEKDVNLIERTCTKIFKRDCSSFSRRPDPAGQNIFRRKSRSRNSVSQYSNVDRFFESHIINPSKNKRNSKTTIKEKDVLIPNSFQNSPFKDPLQAAAFFKHAAAIASSSTPFMSAIPLSTNIFMNNNLPIPPLGLTQRLAEPILSNNFKKPVSSSRKRNINGHSASQSTSKQKESHKKNSQSDNEGEKATQDVKKNNWGTCFLSEKVASAATRDRDKEIIVCTVCDKLMRRGSLREHMDRHLNSGKFECHLCRKTFSRASAREKHIRTHTGERPFICSLCSKAYRQKVHLNEHMRSHTGERPFVCRLCGFSLTSKSLLNRHLRTHGVKQTANEAPEFWLRTDAPTSQVLAAAAEVGRSLVEDEIDHKNSSEDSLPIVEDSTGQVSAKNKVRVTALNGTATVAALCRKHLCNVCPAGFPTIQALRSHRNTTHGVVTPHRCTICDTSFTSIKLLKVHSRKTHPQICPICDQHMPQRRRWILEVHLREQHPDVSSEAVLGPSPLSLCRTRLSLNTNTSGRVTRSSLRRKATLRDSEAEEKSGLNEALPATDAVDSGSPHSNNISGYSDEDLLQQLNFKPMNSLVSLENDEKVVLCNPSELDDSASSVKNDCETKSNSPNNLITFRVTAQNEDEIQFINRSSTSLEEEPSEE